MDVLDTAPLVITADARAPPNSNHGLFILIAYCALTILPLVYLDMGGRKR